MNETLCCALLQARLTEEDIAAHLQVDPKTVRRWLEGRMPYLRHRWAIAAMLGLDETDLWPQLRTRSRPDEVRAIYPRLGAVPEDVWLDLFGSAEREIGILADSAQPIAAYPRVLAVLAERAASGVHLRICLSDLHVTAVAQRLAAQEDNDLVAAQVREALANFAPMVRRVAWRSDCTRPSCTAPSTMPTMNSLSASTPTVSRPQALLFSICAGPGTMT